MPQHTQLYQHQWPPDHTCQGCCQTDRHAHKSRVDTHWTTCQPKGLDLAGQCSNSGGSDDFFNIHTSVLPGKSSTKQWWQTAGTVTVSHIWRQHCPAFWMGTLSTLIDDWETVHKLATLKQTLLVLWRTLPTLWPRSSYRWIHHHPGSQLTLPSNKYRYQTWMNVI